MPIIEQIRHFLDETAKTDKKPLIVILGPTASGKTALSLELAKTMKGEVISCDSRQIYREMDIGTDKVDAKTKAEVPHHLIDIRNPDQSYSLADFQRDCKRIVEGIHRRGKIPMLVGGTGLYISSIVQNYQLPEAPPNENLRKELESELETEGPESLHQMLQELDPLSASKIHPNNHRYLIRALEINLSTQKPIERKKGECPYEVFQIGLEWSNEILYERIHQRVDQQIARGLLDETQRLLAHYDKKLPSMSGLGYKQIVQHLEGEMPLAEAIELIKSETRSYARRQNTWFKRDDTIYWIQGALNMNIEAPNSNDE